MWLKNNLLRLDIFSNHPQLSIKNQRSFSTVSGCITSIFFFLIWLIFGIIVIIDISNRAQTVSVTSLDLFSIDSPIAMIKYNSDLKFMFSVFDSNFLPMKSSLFSFFNFTLENVIISKNNNENTSFTSNIQIANLVPCEIGQNFFNSYYSGLMKNRVYCLNTSLTDMMIGGDFLTNSAKFYSNIYIKPNDNILNNQNEKINFQKFLQENIGGITVFTQYNGIDLTNNDFPNKNLLVDRLILMKNPNLTTQIEVKLKSLNITRDLSLFDQNPSPNNLTTLSDIEVTSFRNDYFNVEINFELSNIMSELKVRALKYDSYLNKFIVIGIILYFIIHGIFDRFYHDQYVQYLLKKYVKINSNQQKDPYVLTTNQEIRRTLSKPKKKNSEEKLAFDYETNDIELANLKINQIEDFIDEKKLLSEEELKEIGDLQNSSDKKKEVSIELNEKARERNIKRLKEKENFVKNNQGRRVYMIEIIYEKHQQEYEIPSSSYFDYYLHLKKKINSVIFKSFTKLCFCPSKRRKLIYELYSDGVKNMLSYENLFSSLAEFEKLKRILFNEVQIELFQPFSLNTYLKFDDKQITSDKYDVQEIYERLMWPSVDYFEHLKNRKLIELMNEEIINSYKNLLEES